MKFKSLIYIFISILFPCCLFGEIGIPAYDPSDQIISHKYYTLKYNEDREQADWVAYSISKENLLSPQVKRQNRFKADPEVNTGSAAPDDYKKSGYDRGHLCPAAAMGFSKDAMLESFYMSNMSPQEPGFNRGIWKRLEAKVRTWALDNDKLFVVSGPIYYDSENAEIGKNNVDVPDAYFKVILDYRLPDIKAIGFILPNKKSSKDLECFSMSIDDVEKITGIDFFSELPDYAENEIEAEYSYDNWGN